MCIHCWELGEQNITGSTSHLIDLFNPDDINPRRNPPENERTTHRLQSLDPRSKVAAAGPRQICSMQVMMHLCLIQAEKDTNTAVYI